MYLTDFLNSTAKRWGAEGGMKIKNKKFFLNQLYNQFAYFSECGLEQN